MNRKLISIMAIFALVLALSACGTKVQADSTYIGTVSAVSADSITLELEKGSVTIPLTSATQLTMGGFGGFGQMGERPENFEDMPTDQERPVPADKPEGDFTMPEGEMPSFPDGEFPEDMTMPEGEFPEDMTMPEGEAPEGFGAMDISSIPVGSSVTVTTGSDAAAATISMSFNFQNFGGNMPSFRN